jgi:biotin carboxyl carrier protein
MKNEFIFQNEMIKTDSEFGADFTQVKIGENTYRISEISSGTFVAELRNVRKQVCCIINNNRAYVDIDGYLLELNIPADDSESAEEAFGGGAGVKDKIFAPMPGKVVKLLVAEGDEVVEGRPLVIVEAMKMENQVNSPSNGKVRKINFEAGAQVDTETPIIELELE